MKNQQWHPPYYEIRVAGLLGAIWGDWFEGLAIRNEICPESEQPITVLYGTLQDQPALHGVLNKIRDLNLTLVSVNCGGPAAFASGQEPKEG